MNELADGVCIPCSGGVPPLKGDELLSYKEKLEKNWELIDEHHLEKEYFFENFRKALDFTIKIGELAENQNHHPDISFGWGYCKVKIFTHAIKGLAESDFILAAKIDKIDSNK